MNTKKLYIETYGCQMNVVDSEVVVSILNEKGFVVTNKTEEADVILINTCSIRENAEQRIRGRLSNFRQYKKKNADLIVGVIGCMAERLKEQLLEEEKLVDLVVGPDAYRDLPQLIEVAESGQKAINVLLSKEETYADISPVRYDGNGISAFVSIMRGCNNMCSYCVVPYTRGRERSRNPHTIVDEIRKLQENGFKEVTLLGQNVDSYDWTDGEKFSFANLLEMVAVSFPEMRIRFATSHPKDMNADVLNIIAKYENVCKNIHLPFQSGSSRILKLMNRKYTREDYISKIDMIREIIPDCGISTDVIAGFCSETLEEHLETMSLMEYGKYDFAYMFKYSERPNTFAANKLKDDVSDDEKTRRLTEIITLQNKLSLESNKNDIGKTVEVLIEGVSKRSEKKLFGRNSQNKVVVFLCSSKKKGDIAMVKITDCTSATLMGELIE
ncbi:MAG TPA: tRNA (N6-isopentenyl adenosine(37)-C2)-methylthiotransferase MiaB [Bacteroidales bacterium]|nr:MAG: tRNA (N6-isopentenyl adenosine(37)-C2)-methylthiotransferase MiaB [Bacteroidetes bacterium GWF2_33_38]OFY88678.1 MAG: tRNA (N6-isopentenyl adenosine(37)-C2)-methylthiotransferase MiaB [Bacteroidetes bacterium RIFOXYA2_FULL_33_7]HBF89153.1 tRNA (N6-isopentenyl adenosine(37)-C2)-methylthiotransferase MiaB [Bacteroidales bacterium]